MKVSANWINQYLDFELPPIDVLVEKIGAQLGAVEEVIDIGKKYNKVVVAKVISCEKHPNADKLKVCMIDDGVKAKDVERNENGHVQVVCGAPNVDEGMLVAWLPPGSTVPNSYDKDPFVLESREIRGIVSNGMIASANELAIGDNHDGILVIDKDASPGQPFAQVYELDDYIIDIENKMFTHRPDAFGQLGVAREVAGILGHKFISPEWYHQPLTDVFKISGATLPLELRNELPELVPRFMAVAMSNVEIKQSPVQIQSYLSRVGIRPINNVVDITNYMMLLTGQPLHAYDYDKVKNLSEGDKAVIGVRFPRDGEKLTLLNGKEIEPRHEAILITTDKQAIGLGGVMGGGNTEVDKNTKNVILEVATFDMYSIRRTSMAHGLFTDAVTRFNKGQSPLQNDRIISKSVEMFKNLSGGHVASELLDSNNAIQETSTVSVLDRFINDRLGLNLNTHEITTLLENVELKVENNEDILIIRTPFWRTDIEIPEDIVEEVGRLYGYDKLPLELPKRSIIPVQKDQLLEIKKLIRSSLSNAGANEALTYSFVHGNLLKKVGQDESLAFKLSNALSPDLQYYRISVLPSLLDKVHPNIKAGYDEFALFELGKSHTLLHKDDDPEGLPQEFEVLSLVYAASDKLEKYGAGFYQARKFISKLVNDLGIAIEFAPIHEMPDVPIVKPYEHSRSAFVTVKGTNHFLGIIGEFKASVRKNLKLPKNSAGFEIDISEIISANKNSNAYIPLPRYPKLTQDITLQVPTTVLFESLQDLVAEEIIRLAPNSQRFISTLDIFQHENDKDHKRITFRISIASYERTMRDEEMNQILNKVATAAKDKLSAERI